jgi:hypothetical protein
VDQIVEVSAAEEIVHPPQCFGALDQQVGQPPADAPPGSQLEDLRRFSGAPFLRQTSGLVGRQLLIRVHETSQFLRACLIPGSPTEDKSDRRGDHIGRWGNLWNIRGEVELRLRVDTKPRSANSSPSGHGSAIST